MKVALRKKAITDNRFSWFLDIYTEGKRQKEYLKLYTFKKPKDELEREHNKETLSFMESLKAKKQLFLDSQEHGLSATFIKNTDILLYFDKYLSEYKKKDIKTIKGTIAKFKDFLDTVYKVKSLKAKELTEEMSLKYKDYLEEILKGESPQSYFARFKKIVKQAYKDKILYSNPTAEIINYNKGGLTKEILSFEEIQRLANAYCGNSEVKRAFLFSLNTGLRWIDIKGLTWKSIDGEKMALKQSKTGETVYTYLNSTAIKLLGVRSKSEELIFTLPSHNGCLKALENWVARAGIDKHITWHCARHSIGVNLLTNGTDLKTTSGILGHTSMKHTEKYTRVVNELKKKAVNSLPEINL